MNSFSSLRVAHEYTQTNPALPEKVFPLLCPVREADWIPGWRYNLVYSDSGVTELGCMFTTPNGRNGNAPESTWICTDYDPVAFRIAYVWIEPGRVATELRIQLTAAGRDRTQSHIRFRYTGLSAEGNREVETYDRTWFVDKMHGWETAINHYLTTGKMIA